MNANSSFSLMRPGPRLQERCVCERESCVLSGGEHFQKAPLIICLDACISLFEGSGDLITQL